MSSLGPFAPCPPRLTLQAFTATWRAEGSLLLPPFPGSTLRGALGRALRPLVCITGADACDDCIHQPHCAYGYVFEGTLSTDAPKRLHTPHRPYQLDLPYTEAPLEIAAGATLTTGIKLFGSARAFTPTLIIALQAAGRLGFGHRRTPAALVEVTRFDPDGARVVVYREGEGFTPPVPAPPWVVEPAEPPAAALVRLHLETPLALKAGGALLTGFDPEVFTARLSERLDALSAAHEGNLPQWDFGWFRRQAAAAEIVSADLRRAGQRRRSDRQRQHIEMEGIVGSVTLRHVHPAVLALWSCAEQVNVGKNAVFGFGRVRIEHG